MQLGVCVRDRPVSEVARLGRFIEAHGYAHLFVPDVRARTATITSGRDAFVSLAAVFEATTELRAGVGVAAVVFHEPDALARVAGSLTEQSDGRFTLGIGVSHREAAGADYPPSPLAEMRRWASEMRRYSRGGGLGFGAGFPVLVGALGPKMVALGATDADGVVLNWLTPEHARRDRRAGPSGCPGRLGADHRAVRADVATCRRTRRRGQLRRARQLPPPLRGAGAHRSGRDRRRCVPPGGRHRCGARPDRASTRMPGWTCCACTRTASTRRSGRRCSRRSPAVADPSTSVAGRARRPACISDAAPDCPQCRRRAGPSGP